MGAFALEESEGGPKIVNPMPENRRRNSQAQSSETETNYDPPYFHSGFGPPTPNIPPVIANSTAGGTNAASGADVLIANDNTEWINKKWRPLMGWVYMVTCTADFVVFPVLWSLLQTYSQGQVTSQWQPLTLQGAGLYHLAMGAIIGITSYGRTKEKIAGSS